MTTELSLLDLLRQLHLSVELVVKAEEEASSEYAIELYTRVLHEHLPRVRLAVESRCGARQLELSSGIQR